MQPDTARDAWYLANTDQNLLKANNFDMNHVLSGEINAAGRATGYHAELAAEGAARIRPGSQVTQNANGTYSAPVQIFDSSNGQWMDKVNARTGEMQPSTFFNPTWSQARIEYEVSQAFKDRKMLTPTQWTGTTPSGIEIQGYTTPARTTFYPTGK